jgi:hypothetical protein
MTNAPDVSNGDRVRIRTRRLLIASKEYVTIAARSFAVAVIIGVITYFALRLRVTYEMQTEIDRLRIERAELVKRNAIAHDEMMNRLDELERVLFGDVLAKVDKNAAAISKLPTAWQRQRDLEFRKRLDALEQWRMQRDKDR